MKTILIAASVVLIATSPCWGRDFLFLAVEMPPIHFVNSDGKVSGVAVEIIIEYRDRIVKINPPITVKSSYLAFSKKKNLDAFKRAFDNELSKASMQEFIRKTMMKYKIPY